MATFATASTSRRATSATASTMSSAFEGKFRYNVPQRDAGALGKSDHLGISEPDARDQLPSRSQKWLLVCPETEFGSARTYPEVSDAPLAKSRNNDAEIMAKRTP
jgi:hypothetical protein